MRIVETHSAVVLLAGDRAYKWKKPVDLGFLDFRGLDQREAACRREIALNRRLAPDVYLHLAHLTAEDGEVLEHLVVMRRLPDSRRLSRLVEEGAEVHTCLRSVARRVAALHAESVTPDAREAASREMLRTNWEDNLATLREAPDLVAAGDVERGGRLAVDYLDGRGPLFEARARLACDGHGDLLAEDIFCLDDGPRIIDCLDFSDRFRMGDPLLDAAFLTMDLERLGRRDLGERFLDWHAEFTGDVPPASLAHHYVAYRAHVRAKVAVLRDRQGDEGAADEARRLHALCLRRLAAGQAPLVLVGGLPGTGKSTVARGVADHLGGALLSSDEARKALLGLDRGDHAPDSAYTHEMRTAVYTELLDRARALLGHGQPVVVDASFVDPAWRETAAGVATETRSPCVALRCEAPVDVVRERLRQRADRGGDASDDASDADEAVHDRLAREVAPWPDARSLDTARDAGEVVADAVALVQGLLQPPPGA